MNTWSLSPI